jgi:rhodanese-related sulfurtransferase
MYPDAVPSVSVADLPAGVVLLDVREQEEWGAGHIDGAVHVPMSQLPSSLARDPAQLPSDQPIVVVCRVGARSAAVTAWLAANGYDARNLAGGMVAWAHAGRPLVSENGQPPVIA